MAWWQTSAGHWAATGTKRWALLKRDRDDNHCRSEWASPSQLRCVRGRANTRSNRPEAIEPGHEVDGVLSVGVDKDLGRPLRRGPAIAWNVPDLARR
jgi:hypothetical protein